MIFAKTKFVLISSDIKKIELYESLGKNLIIVTNDSFITTLFYLKHTIYNTKETNPKTIHKDLLDYSIITKDNIIVHIGNNVSMDLLVECINKFVDSEKLSFACKRPIRDNPEHMMLDYGNGKGESLIHIKFKNLFTVDDKLFIYYGYELNNLNDYLYNNQTYFYESGCL